jgi:hypothetical protein
VGLVSWALRGGRDIIWSLESILTIFDFQVFQNRKPLCTPSGSPFPLVLVPNIIRTRMEEITLARNIQIRNNANLRIIDIHDRKLRHATFSPQTRIVNRPVRFVSQIVVCVGIGVEVGDEGDEPVFHVGGDCDVVCICGG